MIFFLLARSFAFLLDVIAIAWRSDHEKDLEILLLRQQLHILQRKHPRTPRISRWEKLCPGYLLHPPRGYPLTADVTSRRSIRYVELIERISLLDRASSWDTYRPPVTGEA